MTGFQPTTTTFKQGSRTLPGELYTSPAVFADDLEQVHARIVAATLDRP